MQNIKKSFKRFMKELGESSFDAEKEMDKKDHKINYPTRKSQKVHIIIRIIRIIAGFGLIILGGLMGLLPVLPGYPLAIFGLGILSLDFRWAYNLRKNLVRRLAGNKEGHISSKRKKIIIGISLTFLTISIVFSYLKFIKK